MLDTALWNSAAGLGPSRFDWWKDWRGQAVAIIACGPSAKTANVGQLRGKLPVLAIKETAVDFCPWADAVYGCDAAWWKHRNGLPEFKGLKLTWDATIPVLFPDVRKITISDKKQDRLQVKEPGELGAGGNSGFQALNLAVQFGANRIILVGFDLHDRSGAHYYGRNNWPRANNPTSDNFYRWCKAFEGSAGDLCQLGVDVVNASPYSAVGCFRKTTIERAMTEWTL